ncbi:hypothetical protein ACVMB3_005127 [Sinorhizobium meliloti]|uniref:Transmembrane protein n=1 Tax=Sinorhizobium meliloti (strain SM11) TaxID=707241 RepID=F7XBQ4_SINMM|nr:hypothetical protein SM11_pC0203 [Sinorhizobium meliloti SM11]MBP2470772.1 hypothetical protein [Sinorhizobium meliloti]TWA13295.1 hypothetical protein FB006_14422 [Sinorhizobium medicae]TWA33970.1 hypothetical protein FB005_1434 [Sinorhizobium medicae]TWA45907.1 hypothetical protein FB008_12611 [Sinorhizobium medicae]
MGYDWTGKQTRRRKILRGCAIIVFASTASAFLAAALLH